MTLPDFLIIGAAKAGTTALYEYLAEHPQIYMSPQKDTSFFALEGEKPAFSGPPGQPVVCRACLEAWGWKSSAQLDGSEVLGKRKGVAARRGLEEAWNKTAT